MKKALLVLALTLLSHCSEDATQNDPGDCTMKSVDGANFCIWTKTESFQDSDFECPDALEHFHNVKGVAICSDSTRAPSPDIVDSLTKDAPDPETKPSACKTGDIEIASKDECVKGSCYDLDSGKWCTEETKPETCKGEEIMVSDKASCTENGSMCYEIQSGQWCTENPSYQYILLRDTTSGEGCQGTDAGSDLMWIQLLDADGSGLAWASVVKHDVGRGVAMFSNASILSGSPPMVDALGCAPFATEAIYSMGCGGNVLFKFGEKVLPKPIDIHKGEASIVVGEYGLECNGSDADDYELFACTDSGKAATGDYSSCLLSLGPSSGINVFTVPK